MWLRISGFGAPQSSRKSMLFQDLVSAPPDRRPFVASRSAHTERLVEYARFGQVPRWSIVGGRALLSTACFASHHTDEPALDQSPR